MNACVAKHQGAGLTILAERVEHKLNLAATCGCDILVNTTKQDLEQVVKDHTSTSLAYCVDKELYKTIDYLREQVRVLLEQQEKQNKRILLSNSQRRRIAAKAKRHSRGASP